MAYSVKVNVIKTEVNPFTTQGCKLYAATCNRTGVSKIVLDTYENIIFFEDGGLITYGSKRYLESNYTIRNLNSQDSLTIQGTN